MVRGAWQALAGGRPTLGSLLRWDGPGFRRVFMAWMALGSLLAVPMMALALVLAGAVGVAWLLQRGGVALSYATLSLPLLLLALLVLLLLGLSLATLLYFSVNQQFIAQIALLEERGALPTVQRGRALLDPQWLLLLLLLAIKSLLLLMGLVTFGLGLMVAWPVISCITTAAYRQLITSAAGPQPLPQPPA